MLTQTLTVNGPLVSCTCVIGVNSADYQTNDRQLFKNKCTLVTIGFLHSLRKEYKFVRYACSWSATFPVWSALLKNNDTYVWRIITYRGHLVYSSLTRPRGGGRYLQSLPSSELTFFLCKSLRQCTLRLNVFMLETYFFGKIITTHIFEVIIGANKHRLLSILWSHFLSKKFWF